MATLAVTGERHYVRLQPGETLLPGEYTLRDGATVRRHTTSEPCPYCHQPLVHLETAGALRVITPDAEPRANVHAVVAQPIPTDVRVLKCEECRAFFTSAAHRDASATE